MNFKKSLIIGASVLTLAPVASATMVSENIFADEINSNQVQANSIYSALIVNENGDVEVSEEKAISENLSSQEIEVQEKNAQEINTLINDYNGKLDAKTFTVTIYPDQSGSGFRASVRGVTKIERLADGNINVYLNSQDVQEYIQGAENGKEGILGSLLDFAENAPLIKGLMGISLETVKNAAKNGTGVIIKQNGITGIPSGVIPQ